MTNLGDMLKQAQEMQAKVGEMQARMEQIELEGSAGAGMVKVRLNGKGMMCGLRIDATLFESDDKSVLEDLIMAAHNDAKRRVEEKVSQEMAKLTNGLALPPGFKLPF